MERTAVAVMGALDAGSADVVSDPRAFPAPGVPPRHARRFA